MLQTNKKTVYNIRTIIFKFHPDLIKVDNDIPITFTRKRDALTKVQCAFGCDILSF